MPAWGDSWINFRLDVDKGNMYVSVTNSIANEKPIFTGIGSDCPTGEFFPAVSCSGNCHIQYELQSQGGEIVHHLKVADFPRLF